MKYYETTYNDDVDVRTIVDYEMGDFDLTVFWKGKEFIGKIPDCVRLYIDEDAALPESDNLPNPISWLIVSQKLLDIWWPWIKNDVQAFDAPVFRRSDGTKVSGYILLNPIRLVDCVDHARSEPKRNPGEFFEGVYFTLCIKEAKTGGHHMFRCLGSPNSVIVSEVLAQMLSHKGICGIAFIGCETS